MSRALRAVLCLAIVAAPARSHLLSAAVVRSLPAIAESIAPDIPTDRPAFRLGDAAGPFGWSTVVADFDTDGRADVAVADRLGADTRGTEYRLEFSIAGRAPHDVTFASSQDSVTLSVADVDRDNDLDVVVETPLSGEAVGVWLNDGHGNFTQGDVRELPATMRPLQSFGDTVPIPHVAALDSTPRSADQAMPAAERAIDPSMSHGSTTRQPIALRSPHSLDRSIPRAPPAQSVSSLSCPASAGPRGSA